MIEWELTLKFNITEAGSPEGIHVLTAQENLAEAVFALPPSPHREVRFALIEGVRQLFASRVAEEEFSVSPESVELQLRKE